MQEENSYENQKGDWPTKFHCAYTEYQQILPCFDAKIKKRFKR